MDIKKKTIIRFVAIYLALIGIMELLLGLHFFQNYLDINGAYSSIMAWISAQIISFAGLKASSSGPLVNLPGRSLRIAFGCNGLEAIIIYGAAIIAYPAPWTYRLKGMAFGLITLQLLNLARITGLGFASVECPRWFEYIHYYIAQGLMIAVALGAFVLWLKGMEDACSA